MYSMLDGKVSCAEKSRVGVTLLNWMVRRDHTNWCHLVRDMKGARRPRCRYLKKVLGRGNCKCKGPEVRACFVC